VHKPTPLKSKPGRGAVSKTAGNLPNKPPPVRSRTFFLHPPTTTHAFSNMQPDSQKSAGLNHRYRPMHPGFRKRNSEPRPALRMLMCRCLQGACVAAAVCRHRSNRETCRSVGGARQSATTMPGAFRGSAASPRRKGTTSHCPGFIRSGRITPTRPGTAPVPAWSALPDRAQAAYSACNAWSMLGALLCVLSIFGGDEPNRVGTDLSRLGQRTAVHCRRDPLPWRHCDLLSVVD
jgi:hypothetical protein